MASLDLVEMTNNFPRNLAEFISGGPWDIIDSHEGLFLLVRYKLCHTNNWTSWPILAIFNPVTCDLQELPPTPNRHHWFFVGASILRDEAGNGRYPLPRGASVELPFHVSTFKVVCMISMPGVGNDECVIHTLVHLAGADDKWSVHASCRSSRWTMSMLPDRVGDMIFNNRPVRRTLSEAEAISYAHINSLPAVMMINMRTGSTCLTVPPLINGKLLDSCTFVEYCRADDSNGKLWFVCIRDGLMLWLYSHRKPPQKSWSTLLRGDQWTLEREVELRLQIKDLASEAGDLCARNVQSRNGYVFFAIDKYGYFTVHLRSMHVQRLSGVPGDYMGLLYPFLWRQDL
jgi:hypothetical protein